jgi:DNA primase
MSYIIVGILTDFLGEPYSHNESTGQTRFDCPSCAEDKGLINTTDGKHNLEINYLKNKFNCWSCGKTNNMHGPIEKLIKKYGSKKNFNDFLLVKPDNDEIEEYIDNIKKNTVVELPESFKLLKDCTDSDKHSKWAKYYLSKRNISSDIIEKYNIGYCSEGLYKDRIIIPSYDDNGILNYFIARSFNDKIKPKYLNPTVEKQEIIFNEKLINYDTTIFLVEGVFDHIVIPNSIPLLGKVLHSKLKIKLLEKANADIIIVLDGDASKNAKQLVRDLNFDKLKGRVKICLIPDEFDPSLIYEKYGYKGIIKLLKNSK